MLALSRDCSFAAGSCLQRLLLKSNRSGLRLPMDDLCGFLGCCTTTHHKIRTESSTYQCDEQPGAVHFMVQPPLLTTTPSARFHSHH